MRIAMICSCGKRSLDAPPILDIEKILQDYAWKDFKEKSGPVEKIFLRRRDYDVEVPMNYFHFEDSETTLKTRDKSKGKTSAAGHTLPETSVLSTQFRNNTNNSQTYKFRIERTRKATLSVTFQRGFSIGGKAQFKLGLPKALSQAGEVDMRLQISKTTGETFDETLTFEANSDINVEENCNYTANVAFTEREISAEFMVHTTMRMPTGTAPVYIRRRRDHELYATVFINDLNDVFADYKASAEAIDESAKDAKVKRYAIRFTTTGIVEGMRLSGQKIYLDSRKIDKREPSGVDFPAVAQSAAAMISGVGAAHHSGLFRPNFPSDSDDTKDDSNDVMSLNLRTINDGQSETRILKAPQIPTIITTAPSSQETSPPSDAGTSTSLESQSIPDDKNDDVFQKSPSVSSSNVSSPKPSPGKSLVKEDSREERKARLRETRSLSRGSQDDPKSSVELKTPTTPSRPHSPSFPIPERSESLSKSDSLKRKAEGHRSKSEGHRVREPQKVKVDATKIQNVKDLPRQGSNPKELTKQMSNPKELTKQMSNPKELTKQMSNPKELTKQHSNPKEQKQSSNQREQIKRSPSPKELTKQGSNPKELQKQTSNPKELQKQSSHPRDLQKQSSYPKELIKQSSYPKELTKQTSNPKELIKQSSYPRESTRHGSHPKELMKQSSYPRELPRHSSYHQELTKQSSLPKELLKRSSYPKDSLDVVERKPLTRRSFKHETLERMERVSSLSERPRIVPKAGSVPRSSPHSIEAQSSEEDSTSSLSKLSKCTSV